ncbi:hypothetical protein BDV18DRAFT_146537 [Aspergillus unguis]
MDQAITVFHKDEELQLKQQEAALSKRPRRGPLDENEILTLIRICEKRAKYDEICRISASKFWIAIETALEREIGRRYSHVSCRRRIIDLVKHRGAIVPTAITPRVIEMLDWWKDMDKHKEALEKEKALSQLVGERPEVPQKSKLQRVADWVESLPIPPVPVITPPNPLVTPPSTITSQSPVKQDESVSLWARFRKMEEHRAMARVKRFQTSNNNSMSHNGFVSSQQLLSNIKQQLSSTLNDLQPASALSGAKRPREDDDSPDRAAPRPRTQLAESESMVNPVLKQSPGTSHVLPHYENISVQNPMETVFGQFWENMLPYFKERASKDGLCLAKSETIMHEMFKEVGAAMTKAFLKLEQTSRPVNPSLI